MLTDAEKRKRLEESLYQWQQRIWGEPSYEDCEELTDFLSEACRESEPLPIWAIAIRKLVGFRRRVMAQQQKSNLS